MRQLQGQYGHDLGNEYSGTIFSIRFLQMLGFPWAQFGCHFDTIWRTFGHRSATVQSLFTRHRSARFSDISGSILAQCQAQCTIRTSLGHHLGTMCLNFVTIWTTFSHPSAKTQATFRQRLRNVLANVGQRS